MSVYPQANSMPTKLQISTTPDTLQEPILGHIYMHVVANYNTSVDFMEYLPIIEVITNNYTAFCYHFIVVLNDTIYKNEELSAEQNNENALNLVLNEDITNTKQVRKVDNIIIEHVSLTKIMDDSPARKYWRLLSQSFVEFLIRATSIWEKGGIAFNPLVLKTQWSVLYVEKLKSILDKFQITSKGENIYKTTKLPKRVYTHKFNKRVNNIRDIINMLENENDSVHSSEDSLVQMENKNTISTLSGNRKLLTFIEINTTNENFSIKQEQNSPIVEQNKTTKHRVKNNNAKKIVENKSENKEVKDIARNSNTSSSNSLLPSFLDFLFHRYPAKPDIGILLAKNTKKPTSDLLTNKYESSTKLGITNTLFQLNLDTKTKPESETFHPIVVPVKELGSQSNQLKVINISPTIYNDSNRITIDIKGNIIATETKCHAFLGTIFNYAVHEKREEKLTDFIILQLSIFCNGVLSSCKGINLILL